jgi:hypothetical protein
MPSRLKKLISLAAEGLDLTRSNGNGKNLFRELANINTVKLFDLFIAQCRETQQLSRVIHKENQREKSVLFEHLHCNTLLPKIIPLAADGLDLTKAENKESNKPLLYFLAKEGLLEFVELYCTNLKTYFPDQYLEILNRQVLSSQGLLKTPLIIAAEKGHGGVVSFLIKEGAVYHDVKGRAKAIIKEALNK